MIKIGLILEKSLNNFIKTNDMSFSGDIASDGTIKGNSEVAHHLTV